jgi:demethylmenaquinone methyltransferase/2-methoxy-6-polyprenyl-1,4-benzoquinol methylase
MDNLYVPGNSTPIAQRDAQGNTYQLRPLADGTQNRVLKNFPTEAELRSHIAPQARTFDYRALEYYWLVEYTAK